MPVPLTIIVGVGGQGAAIAVRTRQRLLDFAKERADSAEEIEEIEQKVRIYAIDTYEQPGLHTAIPEDRRWILQPPGAAKTVRDRLAPGFPDTFFRMWWPKGLEPGDFLYGAGAMRAKGRLAYYLMGTDIARTLNHAVTELRQVRQGRYGNDPVFVLLAGSLSGGTGSGILLTLAMDIRRSAPPDVKIVAAIPLASIMALGPGSDMTQRIWANCSAGLREVEWWNTTIDLRPGEAKIDPFFRSGGAEIRSAQYPFDLCYLFTSRNRSGRSLGGFTEYTNLIADFLALDINSPFTADGHGMLSNTLQGLQDRVLPANTRGAKPVIFGSAGVASLEYPVDRIAGYLGFRLVRDVLDTCFLATRPGATARAWNIANNLEHRGEYQQIADSLLEPWRDPTTGDELQVFDTPTPAGFANAGKRDVRPRIQAGKEGFDQAWLKNLNLLVAKNYPLVLAARRRAIDSHLKGLLERGVDDRFLFAAQFVDDLLTVLRANQTDVGEQLNHDETGYLGAANRLELAYRDKEKSERPQGAIQELERAWGFLPLPARTRTAKQRFLRSWWLPYTEARKQIVLLTAVQKLYGELITWLDALATTLRQFESAVRTERKDIDTVIRAQLGGRHNAMLELEELVLADPELVDQLFESELKDHTPPSQTARNMVDEMLAGTGGLLDVLKRLETDPPRRPEDRVRRVDSAAKGVVATRCDRSKGIFRNAVARYNLWDALSEEARLRRDMQRPDSFLRAMGPDNGYGLPDEELCRKYSIARAAHCRDTAMAFWYLDVARTGAYASTFAIASGGQVVLAQGPLDGADDPARQALVSALRGVFRGLTFVPGNESPYRLIVARREVGAPPFLIDEAERSELRDNERDWVMTHGHAYVDQRYVGVLPDDLEYRPSQPPASGPRLVDTGGSTGTRG